MSTEKSEASEISTDDLENMSFEELRKRARQLEGEVDAKLVSFSKFASIYRSTNTANSSSDSVPLISNDEM